MKAQLEVKTGFFPLAWILLFCTPVIEINGQKNRRSWGTHYFELPPGRYKVKIFFHYLFLPECGANEVVLDIPEGQRKRVAFYMPPWIFSKGKMKLS